MAGIEITAELVDDQQGVDRGNEAVGVDVRGFDRILTGAGDDPHRHVCDVTDLAFVVANRVAERIVADEAGVGDVADVSVSERDGLASRRGVHDSDAIEVQRSVGVVVVVGDIDLDRLVSHGHRAVVGGDRWGIERDTNDRLFASESQRIRDGVAEFVLAGELRKGRVNERAAGSDRHRTEGGQERDPDRVGVDRSVDVEIVVEDLERRRTGLVQGRDVIDGNGRVVDAVDFDFDGRGIAEDALGVDHAIDEGVDRGLIRSERLEACGGGRVVGDLAGRRVIGDRRAALGRERLVEHDRQELAGVGREVGIDVVVQDRRRREHEYGIFIGLELVVDGDGRIVDVGDHDFEGHGIGRPAVGVDRGDIDERFAGRIFGGGEGQHPVFVDLRQDREQVFVLRRRDDFERDVLVGFVEGVFRTGGDFGGPRFVVRAAILVDGDDATGDELGRVVDRFDADRERPESARVDPAVVGTAVVQETDAEGGFAVLVFGGAVTQGRRVPVDDGRGEFIEERDDAVVLVAARLGNRFDHERQFLGRSLVGTVDFVDGAGRPRLDVGRPIGDFDESGVFQRGHVSGAAELGRVVDRGDVEGHGGEGATRVVDDVPGQVDRDAVVDHAEDERVDAVEIRPRRVRQRDDFAGFEVGRQRPAAGGGGRDRAGESERLVPAGIGEDVRRLVRRPDGEDIEQSPHRGIATDRDHHRVVLEQRELEGRFAVDESGRIVDRVDIDRQQLGFAGDLVATDAVVRAVVGEDDLEFEAAEDIGGGFVGERSFGGDRREDVKELRRFRFGEGQRRDGEFDRLARDRVDLVQRRQLRSGKDVGREVLNDKRRGILRGGQLIG